MKVDKVEFGKFIEESNKIEGIDFVREEEFDYALRFLMLGKVMRADLANYVEITAGAQIRDLVGMDVRVGNHVPPKGGPEIADRLLNMLHWVNTSLVTPYQVHQHYEHLHPFMDGNGRSGRLLWAWQMLHEKRSPGISLGFLHAWYYQTLDNSPL